MKSEHDGDPMTPHAERAAVAREKAVMKLGQLRSATWDAECITLRSVSSPREFYLNRSEIAELAAMNERVDADGYAHAPPAPETVTVGAVNTLRTGTANTLAVTVDRRVWTYDSEDECWDGPDGRLVFSDDPSSGFLHRIASDARVIAERDARIAELEDELTELRPLAKGANDTINDLMHTQDLLKARTAERDAALRALEEKGDGHGAKEHVSGNAGDAGSSPAAPIPLGATLHVPGDPDSPYERVSGGWIRECTPRATRVQRLEKVYRDDDAAWGNVLTQYYHARHPVATRETVERVAELVTGGFVAQVPLNAARKIVSFLGFTLETGDGAR